MRLRLIAAACAAAVTIAGLAGPAAQAAAAASVTQGASAVAPEPVYGAWSTAQELPDLSTSGYVQVYSVSCPPGASDACAVGGDLVGTNGIEVFVSQQEHGAWSTQIISASSAVPSPQEINQVACTSAGNCVAVGIYEADATTGADQVFTVTETDGTWGAAQPLPGIATLDVGAFPDVNGLACPSAGNCVVVGDYGTDLDSNGISSQWDAFLADEVNGVWQPAQEVPGITTLSTAGSSASTITCPATGDCVISGDYQTGTADTSTDTTEAFAAIESGGTWGNAKQPPGTTASTGGEALISQFGCSSAGNCLATGSVSNSDGTVTSQFLVPLSGGTLAAAQKVSGVVGLGSVACPAVGDCVVTAQLGTSAKPVSATLTESNGTWGKAAALPGATSLPKVTGSDAGQISCASVGNCTVVGGYYWDNGPPIAATGSFAADEAGGTWGSAEPLPGLAALNAGDYGSASGLSCSAAASCVAAGVYTAKDGAQLPFASTETPLTPTAATLSLSASSVSYGKEQSEKVTVTVTASGATPTGKVTVKSGPATACTVTLSAGKGSCTLAATAFGAGKVTLTASYPAGVKFAPSTSAGKSFTVGKAKSAAALTLSATKITYGKEQSEKFSVKISPQYSGTPAGKVTIKAASATACTITLSSGKGSCTLGKTALKAGSHHVTAVYAGSTDFGSSTSIAKTLTVEK
jgi:hypothetical protein